MVGGGSMFVSDERNSEEYEDGNIVVNVEKPDNWGEGYAVELAIEILKTRYYQLYAKKYRSKR